MPVKRVLLLAGLAFSISCSDCENRVTSETVSPNSEKRAVVFSRECGATTGFNQQVSIIGAKARLPDAAGNVFICDANHDNEKKLSLDVVWKSPTDVQISYPAQARIFKKKLDFDGVHVVYAPQPKGEAILKAPLGQFVCVLSVNAPSSSVNRAAIVCVGEGGPCSDDFSTGFESSH